MAAKHTNAGPAHAYAQALLDLANERKLAEPMGQELAELRGLAEGDPLFAAFLRDPSIKPAERVPVLERTLQGQVSPLMWNFLGVLNGKDRLGLLEQIAQVYKDLLDKQLGRIDVELTVAQPLDGMLLEEVRGKIAAALKKDPILHQRVDKSILGGMVLRVEDRLIDSSVRQQLAAMRQQMLTAAK